MQYIQTNNLPALTDFLPILRLNLFYLVFTYFNLKKNHKNLRSSRINANLPWTSSLIKFFPLFFPAPYK